jgi:peptidyl-prolyl cis-trans isomerase B (cyclophilin B)
MIEPSNLQPESMKRPSLRTTHGRRGGGVTAFILILILTLLLLEVPGYAEADPPFKLPPRSELLKIKSGAIVTKKGRIIFELFPADAPWHVANFKHLADKGFYRGTTFHLIYPGYVIQGGGPIGNPTGGPGYTLPAEFNSRHHEVGTLGMARLPDDMNPGRESNGSQFHIVIGDSPHMNGSYTIFGKIVQGQDVVNAIERGDVIEDVVVYVRGNTR